MKRGAERRAPKSLTRLSLFSMFVTRLPSYNTVNMHGRSIVFILAFSSILHSGNSQEGCSNIPDSDRFDCYPESDADEQKCLNRGCCWKVASHHDQTVNGKVPLNIPYCFYPTNYGYKLVTKTQTPTGYMLTLEKQGHPGPYGKDINDLNVDLRFETKDRLHFKVWNIVR